MRYEVRFYDALNGVKIAIELTGADRHAAEKAANDYLRYDLARELETFGLVLGAVRELR